MLFKAFYISYGILDYFRSNREFNKLICWLCIRDSCWE